MDIRQLAIDKFKSKGITFPEEELIEAFILGYKEGNNRPPIQINTVESYRSEINSNVSLRDMVCMQQRLTIEEYEYMVSEFIQTQMVYRKIYSSSSEVFNHLRNWIAYQKKSLLEKKNQSKRNEGLL